MSRLRNWGVLFFGFIGLGALFFKLPEAPSLFICKTCVAPDPYLPLIGAAYFALLISLSCLFPSFPKPILARSGLVWALLLAGAMTWIQWCPLCLIAHFCNIAIWTLWTFQKPVSPQTLYTKERVFLLFVAPLAVVAFFSAMNLTLMAYRSKPRPSYSASYLQKGDSFPEFSAKTEKGRLITKGTMEPGTVLNFVTPDCPFCEEQLRILREMKLKDWINITPHLSAEMNARAPHSDWIEDSGSELAKKFRVRGYPTLFVAGNQGTIAQMILGVPDSFSIQPTGAAQ